MTGMCETNKLMTWQYLVATKIGRAQYWHNDDITLFGLYKAELDLPLFTSFRKSFRELTLYIRSAYLKTSHTIVILPPPPPHHTRMYISV